MIWSLNLLVRRVICHLREHRGLWGTAPEQVEIFCGPVRLWGPRSEEHGALQDERVSMG